MRSREGVGSMEEGFQSPKRIIVSAVAYLTSADACQPATVETYRTKHVSNVYHCDVRSVAYFWYHWYFHRYFA